MLKIDLRTAIYASDLAHVYGYEVESVSPHDVDGYFMVALTDETDVWLPMGEVELDEYGTVVVINRNGSEASITCRVYQPLTAANAKAPDLSQPAQPAHFTERQCFMVEAAMQRGFVITDDDGDKFACTSQEIVDLLTPIDERYLAFKEALQIALVQLSDLSHHWPHSELSEPIKDTIERGLALMPEFRKEIKEINP